MLGQWNLSRWCMENLLSLLVMQLDLLMVCMGMMLAMVKLQLSLLQDPLPMQPGDGVLWIFLKAGCSVGIARNKVETVETMLHLKSSKILHLEFYQNIR